MSAVLLLALASTLGAQSLVHTRVIEREMNFHTPIDHCAVPMMATIVARASRIPIGIERLPGKCETDRAGERLFVKGMTVAAVLDTLVSLDPRYRWIDSDGVIVVRPVDAWENRSHYLHQIVRSFVYDDVNIGMAHELMNSVLGPRVSTERLLQLRRETSPDADHRFAVRLPDSATKLDVLNAIARAHGAMWWDIDYCLPEVRRELAMITFVGWRTAIDHGEQHSGAAGAGITGNKVYTRDAQGHRVDPCRPGAP